ncbi:MAG: hypothetical protein D6735_10600 [Acidobacteria bacterium]|nr:MAG: hypothetical protein D6735_10600 [Acidobacteriota bacterium]
MKTKIEFEKNDKGISVRTWCSPCIRAYAYLYGKRHYVAIYSKKNTKGFYCLELSLNTFNVIVEIKRRLPENYGKLEKKCIDLRK